MIFFLFLSPLLFLPSSSELLHHGVELVPILEAQARRSVVLADALAVEHEAGRVGLDCFFGFVFFFSGGRGRRRRGEKGIE